MRCKFGDASEGTLVVIALLVLGVAVGTGSSANAKGCIKGAIVGGVADGAAGAASALLTLFTAEQRNHEAVTALGVAGALSLAGGASVSSDLLP